MPWHRNAEPARRATGRPHLRGLARVTLVVAAGVLGCAKEEPPPGALPDRRPPGVARFVPSPDSVVPGFRGAARIRFDEPVNLGTGFGRRIAASPADRFDVGTGFSEVRIRPRGGWRPGAVYCFQLPEGIADLLGNRTPDPIDYCFSTGPPVAATRVEGSLVDRLTGSAVPGARVLFLGLPADTTPYTAVADSRGSFRLRALPPGTYWAYGFQDRNGNRRLDRLLEPYDSLRVTVVEDAPPASLTLALLEPDSTPPRLVGAAPLDSSSLRLDFDDAVEPEQPDLSLRILDAEGSEVPWRTVRVGDPQTLLREVPDGTPVELPDTAAAAPPDTAAARKPVRPARQAVVWLERTLEPGVFRIRVDGVRNLWGLVGGGDTTFVVPGPPEGAGEAPGEDTIRGPEASRRGRRD